MTDQNQRRDVASEETARLDPPSFGHYRVVAKIGEGGMGAVYKVSDGTGTIFALKSLNAESARNAEYVHRFLREARLALVLRHPHIVRTLDTGHSSDGSIYIVSEFCSRGNLLQHLDAHGPLPAELAVHWLTAVTAALDYAWREHSMIHRDIKPANILLDSEGRVKLADLGLAKRLTTDATQLTAAGTALGSVRYVSPEQASARKDIDCRADLYSLGATFYHLLRGAPMFEEGTPVEILMHHVNDPPPPLGGFRPDLPGPLVDIVHRLLAKNPADRPHDPAALLVEIETLAGGMGIDLDAFVLRPSADSRRTVAVDGFAPPSDAGMVSVDPTTVLPGERRVIVLRRSTPSAAAWPAPRARLTLEDLGSSRRWDVAVYAGTQASFGRSRAGDVDIPIRVYPLEDMKAESMRISQRHGQFDARDDGWTVTDLGSRNGITVGGNPIEHDRPHRLPTPASVRVPAAVTLTCHSMPRERARFFMIDSETVTPTASPALVILRDDNRPELAYAIVREHLPIGGGNAATALTPPGFDAPACGALWWLGGSFWWNAAGSSDLTPLAPGARWDSPGARLALDEFTYDMFR